MRPRRPVQVLLGLVVCVVGCGGIGGGSNGDGNGSGSSAYTTPIGPSPTTDPVPPPGVLVVVLENREYSEVVGNSSAPFLNDLIRRGGLATRMYATTHPSLPNYLELIGGQTAGISSDCTDCSVDVETVVDQLQAHGLSWRAYMNGVDSPCPSDASNSSGYAKKHDPFVYIRHISANPAACANVVPGNRLADEIRADRLPSFGWLTPTLCEDGHDCDLGSADSYARRALTPLLNSPWYARGGTLVVTWDEGSSDDGCCAGAAHGGHVATIVVSRSTRPGSRLDTELDQAGLLRAVEEHFRLPLLADAAHTQSGDLRQLLGS